MDTPTVRNRQQTYSVRLDGIERRALEETADLHGIAPHALARALLITGLREVRRTNVVPTFFAVE